MPFDNEQVLFDFLKSKLLAGDIILIDKVLDECKYIAKKIILKQLFFLDDKQFLKSSGIPYKTDSLLAPSPGKFLRMVDDHFAISVQKGKLTAAQYETEKNAYLNSADIKQIILCMNLIKNHEDVVLLTEESRSSNDSKLFKKIPAICNILGINSISLPDLLSRSSDIEIKCCKRGRSD
jgi:hypothetical protein